MPERWQRELRRLGRVGPSQGLWDRAKQGPRASHPPPSRGPRLTAAVVALLVLSLTGVGLWSAFRPGRQEPTRPGARGYFVSFPKKAGPSGDNPNGGASLVMTTNLPNGTLVWLIAEGVGGPGGNSTCCPPTENGRITFQVNNGSCYLAAGAVRSTGFTMMVKVLPEYRFRGGLGNPSRQSQPPSVQAILGPRFEHLTGPQVRMEKGGKELIATAGFDWPPDNCEAGLRSNDTFLPDECPTTDTQGHPLAMIQAADPGSLMDQLMPAIAQIRLCEIWRSWMVPAYRPANPWPAFRERTRAWIEMLGDLSSGDPEQFTVLTWRFVVDGPDRYVADVMLRGRRVAQMDFVPLPFPKGCASGCEPFWGFNKFDLIEQ